MNITDLNIMEMCTVAPRPPERDGYTSVSCAAVLRTVGDPAMPAGELRNRAYIFIVPRGLVMLWRLIWSVFFWGFTAWKGMSIFLHMLWQISVMLVLFEVISLIVSRWSNVFHNFSCVSFKCIYLYPLWIRGRVLRVGARGCL